MALWKNLLLCVKVCRLLVKLPKESFHILSAFFQFFSKIKLTLLHGIGRFAVILKEIIEDQVLYKFFR